MNILKPRPVASDAAGNPGRARCRDVLLMLSNDEECDVVGQKPPGECRDVDLSGEGSVVCAEEA